MRYNPAAYRALLIPVADRYTPAHGSFVAVPVPDDPELYGWLHMIEGASTYRTTAFPDLEGVRVLPPLHLHVGWVYAEAPHLSIPNEQLLRQGYTVLVTQWPWASDNGTIEVAEVEQRTRMSPTPSWHDDQLYWRYRLHGVGAWAETVPLRLLWLAGLWHGDPADPTPLHLPVGEDTWIT